MAGDGRSGLSESKRNRAPKAARRSGDQCELSIQTKLIEDSHLLDNFRGFLQTRIAACCSAMRDAYSGSLDCVPTESPPDRPVLHMSQSRVSHLQSRQCSPG